MSKQGAGTKLHKDQLDSGFWNACIHGRKRWWVTAGWNAEAQRMMAAIMPLAKQLRMDPHAWFDKVYPEVVRRLDLVQYDFIQEEGDLVFVPAGGYWHQVVSLTDSVSVSENLVVTEHEYRTVFSAICVRSERHTEWSRAACTALRDVHAERFNTSCCPAFLRNPRDFPMATALDEMMLFPHSD